MSISVSRYWKEYRSFLVFLVLMFMFRSAIADWNTVPSASMKPTLLEGDRIGLNKMAYDLRIPFSHISLYKVADPARGEIAVFDSKAADNRLVKRVIGVPGDKVAMRNNQLFINGEAINYKLQENEDWIESLPNKNHMVRLNPNAQAYANFTEATVPENHYLMLGDNRDNSADSRVIGFVPRNEFVGRTTMVVMSFNYDNFYIPRSDRFFHNLH